MPGLLRGRWRSAAKSFPSVEDWILTSSDDLVWVMVDEVEEAFRVECGSLNGRELLEHIEVTNAILRTAWPVVLKALKEQISTRTDGTPVSELSALECAGSAGEAR